jgi:hypothetical protein
MYSIPVRSKSLIITDSSELETIKREFAALCCTKYFNGVCGYECEGILI